MRPEKLVMENFGPFSGRAELDFSKLEDIFLISGKTGAGKTTIFDAICFALYGKVPGSRGDHPLKLKSDHASEEDDCFVSLEFTLGEKRYLAERSPKQERKKKRGTGTTDEEETLVFRELGATGNAGSSAITHKKSELDQKLKELIGLEADEFFKIVLLPQGEFAEFLKQSTSERQKVLGKLFPVEKALKVKELARRKTSNAEAEVNAAIHILEAASQKVNKYNYQKLKRDAASSLEAAEKKTLALEKEEAAMGRILAMRKSESECENRLEESRKQLEEEGAKEAAINEKDAALSRSRSARPLEQHLRSFDGAELSAKTAQAALEAAKTEKEKADIAAAKTEETCAALPALEKEANDLRGKRPALAELLEEEEALETNEQDLKKQEAQKTKLSDEISRFLKDLEKQEASIKEAETLAAELPVLDEKYAVSKAVKDLFMDFRKYRERLDNLEKEKIRTKSNKTELSGRLAEFERNIPVLEAEIRKIKEEKSKIEQADMAARLGAFLEAGKPCPVCGSLEHPRPAGPAGYAYGLDDRLSALELSLREAEKSRSSSSASLEAAEKEAAKIEEDLKVLEREIAGAKQNALPSPPASYHGNAELLQHLIIGAALPRGEKIDRLIKIEADGLNEIIKMQKAGREAAQKRQELYRVKTETLGKKGEAEKRLAAAEEQKKNLMLTIARDREKRRKILGTDSETVRSALASLDKIIAEKDNLIAHNRKERENALVRQSGAASAKEAAEKNKNDSSAALEKAGAALEKALAEAGFRLPEEAEKALLDPGAEASLEQEIINWRENRTAIRTQIAEQKKQLDGIRLELAEIIPEGEGTSKAPLLEEAENRLTALKAERAAAGEEKNKALTALANLEKDREALEDAQKRYDELSSAAAKFKKLSDDLSGKNPKKLPFDAWLLGKYLEEAAAYATARLRKMSESRYSLLLDTERQGGRANTGLDLQVFDAHTGKTRPCATLSGGESFMASISLALGLADSIQNRSGGVRLDAVFIDEGFGSLDETSLDKAMIILDELRDRRMVGIISHVSELRSRIPCRVEVVKTSAGSHIA